MLPGTRSQGEKQPSMNIYYHSAFTSARPVRRMRSDLPDSLARAVDAATFFLFSVALLGLGDILAATSQIPSFLGFHLPYNADSSECRAVVTLAPCLEEVVS
jgi:hypothetical protein